MPQILLLTALLFQFLIKYSFVITNQYTQIPIVLSFINRGTISNDWYINVSRNFNPRTFFAIYTAFWGKLFGLPATYLLHYLLTSGLILYASYKLSLYMFKNVRGAILTSLTVLFGATYSIGGNLLVTRDFTVTQLALSLSLAAIVALLSGKFIISSILFILSSYLHPLIGPESALISFTAILAGHFIQDRKKIKAITADLFKLLILP